MIHRYFVLLIFVLCFNTAPRARAQGTAGYPAVFNTNQVLHLNVSMDPNDFEVIRNDATFDIEAFADFWADGEEADPLLVSIRRKSADSINGKVSYKIDINKYINGQKWNELNKLSLENGDDQDVVAEGFAWYMHRVASGTLGTYSPSMAAWTTLTINGQPQGVYVNVEQVDKQYLRNRSLWVSGESWLFFQDDRGNAEFKEGPVLNGTSPTMQALNFKPFVSGNNAPAPPQGAALQSLLNEKINMGAMLMLGAVNAFSSNPDELFNHAKNFFWADFEPGSSLGNSNGKRMYFPWDLDAAIQGANSSIYGTQPYQQIILGDPLFRRQYNMIMLSLLEGPLSVQSLTSFLDEMEPILTPYLQADPNNRIGSDIAGRFTSLRNWVAARHANVYQQVINDLAGAVPGDYNGNGKVDAADFVLWRKGVDDSYPQTAYDVWQRRFGSTSGGGSSTFHAASVPEPFALLLFAAGCTALAFSRCQRSNRTTPKRSLSWGRMGLAS